MSFESFSYPFIPCDCKNGKKHQTLGDKYIQSLTTTFTLCSLVSEGTPWKRLCVDLIGPYTIKRKAAPPLKLWCVTMIDPATGWFEMKQIETKTENRTANLVEQVWLSRYSKPTEIIYDKGTEFMGKFAQMVKKNKILLEEA